MNAAAVRFLLVHADVNHADPEGCTPLLHALRNKERYDNQTVEDMVRVTVEAGADVNTADNDGRTPLHWAMTENATTEVVQVLLDAGADVNNPDDTGSTPLIVSLDYEVLSVHPGFGEHDTDCKLDLMRLLVMAGADVNHAATDGTTPLYAAITNGAVETVRLLLENGADVKKANSLVNDPLLFAVVDLDDTSWDDGVEGKAELLRLLLDAGLKREINIINDHGLTPLYSCVKAYGSETYQVSLNMIRSFLENGANVRKANTDGTTPLQAAIELGHVAVVNVLNEYRDYYYYQRTREWIRSTLEQQEDLPVRRHWLVKMLMYHTEDLLTYNDEYPDMHLLSDALIKILNLN